jgi:O-antigen ligase
MRGFVLGACCVALAAWTMPAQPDLRLGDEEFFNTNQIGNLCAFAVFPALYLMRRAKERWGLAIFFLGVTLLRSLSKTTIAAFLVSACFLLIYDRTISRNSKVALTLTAALVVSLFWGLIEAYYDVYTTAGNQAETLTGRVGIWAFVLDAALEHPWFGHGFDSVWKVIPAFGVFEARHAENELLQQFYAYGLAGVCMLAGIYGSLCRQFMRVAERPVRAIFLSLLLYIMVRGLAEAEPFDLLLPLAWVVVLSLLADQPGTELPDALRAPHGGTALSEFF